VRRLARRPGSGYGPGLIRPKRRSGYGTRWRPARPWVVACLREFPEAAYELRVRRTEGSWQVTVLDEARREVVRVDAATRRETNAVVWALLGRMTDGGSERL